MRNIKDAISAFSAAFLLVACGDTVENVNQMGMDVVDSVADLPKCTSSNEGEQALVKGESTVRVCVDGEWFATASGDAGDFSCKTVELKDKSGLKIVCNGDSIGVVLNGNDGKAGKDGQSGTGCSITDRTDSTMTVVCGDSTIVMPMLPGTGNDTLELDSERVAVSLDSLAGYSQKGPFLKGSTVYLYELSDGRTLKQTNGNFTSLITRDDGRYKFTARDLASQYAMIVVEGYYRNEVTGKPSNASIRLRAITDMRKRSDANINLLTHLEFDRVYYLVTREHKTVKQAKNQAQKEIFKAFHIDTTGIKVSAEDLDVFGKSDADAALLAISVLLQGDGSETDLSVLLTEIANDMETDGEWNDSATRAKIADWAVTADTAGRLDSVYNHVEGWGLGGGNVPDFKKVVRNFWYTENRLGACGDGGSPLGTVKEITNENSTLYYARNYADTVITDVRFICDSKSHLWRPATDIEKDTAAWGVADEGMVHVGQINRKFTYVFQDGHWRLGTAMDNLLKKKDGSYDACLKTGDISELTYEDYYYRCDEYVDGAVRGWVRTDEWFNDTYDSLSECREGGRYGDGTLLDGRVNKKHFYVCDDGAFRNIYEMEEALGKGCVSYNRNKNDTLGVWHSSFTCTSSGWVFDSANVITDPDDGKTYKTIRIITDKDTMFWMAENLNKETDESVCYDNKSFYCGQYGRLYNIYDAACSQTGVTDGARQECMEKIKNGGYYEFDDPKYAPRGVCPIGWHLPTNNEFHQLLDFINMNRTSETTAAALKSTSGWYSAEENGTDEFGFSILPGGMAYYLDVAGEETLVFEGVRQLAYILVYAFKDSWRSALVVGASVADIHDDFNEENAFSVRCVKDYDWIPKVAVE